MEILSKANKSFLLLAILLGCIYKALGENIAETNYITKTVNTTQTATQVQSTSNVITDYGIVGHTFPIIEQSLLEVIMARLKEASKDGRLEVLQEQFKEKAIKKIMHPTRVENVKLASANRSWTYDPTIIQIEPILDHQGKVIIEAGTTINPLDQLSWGEPLLLIDGEDLEQIEWVIKQQGKIVLINGSPVLLSKQLEREVFFDQGGLLTERFRIGAVPVIVEQEGKLLRVSEVKI